MQLAEMLKELKSRSKAKVIVESGFLALILLILFAGNFITLLIMALNRRMRTISNMFVASLAISDIGLGAFIVCPLGFSTLAISQWPFNDATCQYQGYIAITLAMASTQTLALMAVNRYFRIVRPLKYRRYFTKKKTIIMVLSAWFFSLCAPLPHMLSGHKMVFHPSKFFCYFQIDGGPFLAFLATVYVGLPACLIFYCYLRIFKFVRYHNNNFQITGYGTSRIHVEEIKVTRTLFVIVVFFSLCCTPILSIDIFDTIRGSWTFPREAYVAYSFLATISGALNPIIYGVLNKNFQNEYLKILRCKYWRSQRIIVSLAVEGGAIVEQLTLGGGARTVAMSLALTCANEVN